MKTGKRTTGLTLLELLIAFMVLALLTASMVSLSSSALNAWREGEERKDLYDRAQMILLMAASDLRNVYAENCWHAELGSGWIPPLFQGDFDRNSRPRVAFVRTGNREEMRVSPENAPPLIIPEARYTDLWEVAWVMDEDPASNVLYRGVRFFDRRKKGSLFDRSTLDRTSQGRFQQLFSKLDDGVLYLGFQYWTQNTQTWEEEEDSSRRRRGAAAIPIWDSTRNESRKFPLYQRNADRNNPDFVYPEMVRVSLTLESTAGPVRGVTLDREITREERAIPVSTTQGLPAAPDFVKIGGEWIEYSGMGPNELVVRRRGVRGTRPEPHRGGDRVRFGKTFVTEVYVPVYREAEHSGK